MNIFDFSDYKALLRAQIAAHAGERGYQGRVADAAGCQRTYLSQALHTKVQLTLDHAAGIAQLWSLDAEAADYFFALVEHARAATPRLRAALERKLATLREQAADLGHRLRQPGLTDDDAARRYYAAWFGAALHIATAIPAFNTSRALARRLSLPEPLVLRTLDELVALGLVARNGVTYEIAAVDLHLPKDSPFTVLNHFNWRQRGLLRLQEGDANGLHYTAVHALALADIPRLREALAQFALATREIVAPSPPEELVCVACDLFVV